MASGGQVAVWEWLNEFGSWAPYSSLVSNYIEQHHTRSGNNTLNLGKADANLGSYTLDIQGMVQIRQNTGVTSSPLLQPDKTIENP